MQTLNLCAGCSSGLLNFLVHNMTVLVNAVSMSSEFRYLSCHCMKCIFVRKYGSSDEEVLV